MKKIFSLLGLSLLPFVSYSQVNQSPRDTLSKIADKAVIVLAVRESSAPFSYYDAKGNTIGYSVELCERVAKKIRKDLNLPSLKIVYLPVQPAERMDVVKNGLADMECGVTTHTKEREKNVDFSVGVFAVETRFVTPKGLSINGLEDLSGKPIAVTSKSIGETYVNQEKIQKNLTLQINPYKDTKEAILSVVNGANVAHPNDDILLYTQLAFNPSMKDSLQVTGTPISPNTYGIVLPKGDIKFKTEVDTILKDLMASGEINKIYEKWFLNPIPPKNVNINFPMNNTTKKIFTTPTDVAFIEK